MESRNYTSSGWSRRNVLAGSAAVLAAGAAGATLGGYASTVGAATEPLQPAPPLPWKWVTIDPDEAGRRAYRFYFDKGGCGSGAYLGLLSMLREEVGYPWTTLPDMMMSHAAAGYGGHGTLCGALGGAACIINLVAYGKEDEVYRQMIDRLFYWYAQQEFPTDRFDDISKMPGQVKVLATTPLCHTSVSKWVVAAGEEVTSKAKKERCAKVTGEVVYIVATALNEYFAGNWTPPAWEPSDEIKHCIRCHGPDDMWHGRGPKTQQGHMECLLCHEDHTPSYQR